MAAKYELLIVDDEVENLELLRRVFRGKFRTHTALSGSEALSLAEQHDIDLLLTDYRMPGMNGVELMEAVRKLNPHAVRIVLTGYSDPQDIIDAINRGEAYRYLTKPFKPSELLLAVEQALEKYQLERDNARMLDELKTQNDALRRTEGELRLLNEELEKRVTERTAELAESKSRLEDALEQVTRLARTDSLTGMWNRRYFFELAEREIDRAMRFQHELCVLMIDLDHFKEFNDTLGHQAGDAALHRVAEILTRALRTIDLCGRYGGEEFIVLLPETSEHGARTVAERLRRQAEQLTFADLPGGQDFKVTLSIGGARFSTGKMDLGEMIAKADDALYRAKGAGRNRVVFD